MRNDLKLPLLALVGGAAGFCLRRWQWRSAYSTDTQLFTSRAPATLVLMGVLAVVLVLLLLSLRTLPAPGDFLPAFRCPVSGHMTLMAAAGFLVLAGGVLDILDGMERLQMWRMASEAAPGTVPLAPPFMQLVCAVLSLIAGLALLLVGKATYRQELSGPVFYLVSMPGFAGLAWALSVHLDHGVDPVLMRYCFPLLAAALLALAHYYAAAFLFRHPCPRRFLFCALFGAVTALTALADVPHPAEALLLTGFTLSALALAHALLRNTWGEPWPEPERMPLGAEHEDEEPTEE